LIPRDGKGLNTQCQDKQDMKEDK